MCGIVGIYGYGSPEILLKMRETLTHRGPDGAGVFIEPPVYLGHRRLKILDLTDKGAQPMSNKSKTIWITYNGEIYNFLELKRELQAKGHEFVSATDTEVIIYMYEQYGPSMFSRLNGMFAMGIWDATRKNLLLARDRFGQKPLFYTYIQGTFLFASEASAIIEHPLVSRELNLNALAKYLLYEHVPTPDAIWKNLKKLLPGHFLTFDPSTGDIKITRFWKPVYYPVLTCGQDEYLQKLDFFLERAVSRHLISDVPVGIYMSGGTDSSTVAYYAARASKSSLVNTFTVAFNESSYGEQYFASLSAKRIGSVHKEIPFSITNIDMISEVIQRLDEPFADSSLVPAYYLNKYAKPYITVALGGEGGDELFVGYEYFRAYEIAKKYRLLPKPLRSYINSIINMMPATANNMSLEYKLKKFIESNDYFHDPLYSQQIWVAAFTPKMLRNIIKTEILSEIDFSLLLENVDIYRNMHDQEDNEIDMLMRHLQVKYLMDDGLAKIDRAAMLNSIEGRSPMLDIELFEWVNQVPFSWKYRRGTTKYILRLLMKDKLPREIMLSRKKMGFTSPIALWFTTSLKRPIEDILFSKDDFFNQSEIQKLWVQHNTGKFNHRKPLWTLLVWKLWWDSVNRG